MITFSKPFLRLYLLGWHKLFEVESISVNQNRTLELNSIILDKEMGHSY